MLHPAATWVLPATVPIATLSTPTVLAPKAQAPNPVLFWPLSAGWYYEAT